jgi:hypothetical protein
MLGLMALAAIPRLVTLGSPGLTRNEDYAMLCARAILEHGVPVLPSGGLYPRALPFSYATAAMVKAFGEGEAVLRFLPALFSIATVGLAYAFARRVFGRGPAVVAGLVLALSQWEIMFGRTARMYSALSFLFLLALYATYRVASENDPRWRAPGIAAGMLAILLHQLAAVLVVPYAALLGLRRSASRRVFVVVSLAIVGLTLLGVIVFERSVYAGFDRRVAGVNSELRTRSEAAHPTRRPLTRRGGAISALIVGAAFVAAGAAWRTGKSVSFALAVFLTALLVGFQYAMLAAYAAAAYLVLGFVSGRPLDWAKTCGLGAVVAGGGAAWLTVEIAAGGVSRATGVARALIEYPPNFLEFYARLQPGMFLVVIVATLVALVGFARHREAFTPHLYLASAVVLSAIGLGFHPGASTLFNERYVYHLNTGFVLLYAFGVWWIAERAVAAAGEAAGTPRMRSIATGAAVAALLFATGGLAPARTWAAARQHYGENERIRGAWGESWYVADHQGSSRFVCENAGPDDVIVAMDILVHWAYCPRADFQLTLSRKGDAEGWIGVRSGDSLDAIASQIASRPPPRVWIVLSGQEIGIRQIERNPRLETMLAFRNWDCAKRIYEGRDGRSDVWVLDGACLLSQLP